MENTCLKRLLLYLQVKGIGKRSLAEMVDMNEKTLGGKLNGNSKIDMDLLSKMLMKLPDLSAEWLIRGNGEMFLETKDSSINLDFRHQKQGDFSAMDNGTVNVGDMEAANKAKMLSIVEKIVNSPNTSAEAMDKAMEILEKIV